MIVTTRHVTPATLALFLGLGQMACSNRGNEDAAPAPVDTSLATVPIIPPAQAEPDSAPAGAATPSPSSNQPAQGKSGKLSMAEYEGWRQYSVNCARCHGQDVLPNPVAANLLISLRSGGPIASADKFMQVVSEGRPDRGMPAFKVIMSPDQVQATYAYVKGRAEGRISPGRPERPGV